MGIRDQGHSSVTVASIHLGRPVVSVSGQGAGEGQGQGQASATSAGIDLRRG